MDKELKEIHKKEFRSALKIFVEKLTKYVSTDTGEWTVKGFIDVYKNIYRFLPTQRLCQKYLRFIYFLRFFNLQSKMDIRLFSQKSKTGILISV